MLASPRRPAANRRPPAFAAAGPFAFVIAWAAAAALQPGFRPLRDDESALAAVGAAHPWITMSGELLLAWPSWHWPLPWPAAPPAARCCSSPAWRSSFRH